MLAVLESAVAANKARGTQEQIKAFCMTYVGYFLSHRAFSEIVFLNIPLRKWQSDASFVQYQHLGIMLQLLKNGQSEGVIRQDGKVEDLLVLLAGATYRYMVHLLTCDQSFDPQAEGEKLNHLLAPLIFARV